jgi:hypothetical protein
MHTAQKKKRNRYGCFFIDFGKCSIGFVEQMFNEKTRIAVILFLENL